MTCAPSLQGHRRPIALLMLVITGLAVLARLCLAMAPLGAGTGPGPGDCPLESTCAVVCQVLEADRQADPQPPVPPHSPPWLPGSPPPRVLPLALLDLPTPTLPAAALAGLWPTLRCRVLLI